MALCMCVYVSALGIWTLLPHTHTHTSFHIQKHELVVYYSTQVSTDAREEHVRTFLQGHVHKCTTCTHVSGSIDGLSLSLLYDGDKV